MKRINSEYLKNNFLKFIVILVCILPTLISTFYIMPVADDFANSLQMKELMLDGGSYFGAAVSEAGRLYFEASGYFFAAFLNMFFSPFLRWGVTGVRLFVFCVNLLLYITLYFGVRFMMRRTVCVTNQNAVMTVTMLLILCFTNIYLNREATFWYCVSVAYVLVFICMLWGWIFFVEALTADKKRYMAAAAALGFLVSGSSLNITALNCFVYLLIGICGFLVLHKRKESVLCFCAALAGGLINVAAPGNYVRHDSVSGEYNILHALEQSVRLVYERIHGTFTGTLLPFILVALLFLLLFIPLKVKVFRYLHPILLICGFIAALVVIAFPVYLGYGDEFPQRCYFIQDGAMYLFSFSVVFYSAGWLKERYGHLSLKKEQAVSFVILFSLVFCLWNSDRSLTGTYPSVTLAKKLVTGDMAEFRDYWEDIFDEIENGENNVVIERVPYAGEAPLVSPGLVEDKDMWINSAVARYYGRDSVQVIWDTEDNKE